MGEVGRNATRSLLHSRFADDVLFNSMKASGEQMDDRIVEVHWDVEMKGWRMMRFRDDKPNGNHKSVVENIIKSIADGVEKDAVSRSTIPSSRSLLMEHSYVTLISFSPARTTSATHGKPANRKYPPCHRLLIPCPRGHHRRLSQVVTVNHHHRRSHIDRVCQRRYPT